MSNASDTYLTGSNIDFLEAQYARYLENPSSVDGTWQELFRTFGGKGRPIVTEGLTLPKRNGNGNGNGYATGPLAAAGVLAEGLALQGKVDQTIFSFRLRGHLISQLDPLGEPRPPLDHVADIGLVSRAHFSEGELAAPVETQSAFDETRVPLKRLLERMRRTYCEHIGVEYIHLYDSERRRWLMRRMEQTENRTEFTVDEQKRIFLALAKAEAFEQTIHTKFQGQKRFSIEGGKSLLPMVEELLETGGALGVREVVIGMPHRGRLAMLANICGKPAEEIFSEISGPTDPKQYLNRGDVKYHMGYSSDWTTRAGQKVHLSMAFNPSHLGVVHPVVEGRARAKQDRVGPEGRHAILPLAIHGDAAFAGQGLVAETLNLSALKGYDTGGTVHIVVNNQIGYTTEADQGRSSLYCTGIAQMLDIPVFHVNGDDPEACVHVMRVAAEYRQRFHTDVVIDLVCFRRYGHNEGDVPEFTQPKMYEIIKAKKSVRITYGDDLAKKGRVSAEESTALFEGVQKGFIEAFNRSKATPTVKDPSHLLGVWAKYKGGADTETPQVETGVPRARLDPLLEKLSTVPDGFTLHKNVAAAVIDRRRDALAGKAALDWGTGEMLAYATLVTEGYRVRVTGQDTERGTFAHRHAVLHDMATGKTAFPLGTLHPGQAIAEVINSPLSEMACMGFEFGYSLDYPDALVAWEAQFGDFANNGQVMIDQFIAAAEDKWKRLSGLTLLLPHGYEGAGPEHSSARLERFLELAAEDNMQVCYPTSSAQVFHLLRRQAVRLIRKPLVVMTPKSLLRAPEAASKWEAFTSGTYRRVIAEAPSNKVTRLLLCSGKVFYDLEKARKTDNVAIARLEQLYPLPLPELTETLKAYPKLDEVYWVQEEPKNSGAWRYLLEHLMTLIAQHAPKAKLSYVGRPESASPATGFLKTHQLEQATLVEEALGKGN
ncbi:MAG: 2-oxoglutarate dehydrogenase E1 component [Archangiaceae bacterium]|nr:2-oxoglutarate dehydrogenase E1 component [Archangiaceae bacterium]